MISSGHVAGDPVGVSSGGPTMGSGFSAPRSATEKVRCSTRRLDAPLHARATVVVAAWNCATPRRDPVLQRGIDADARPHQREHCRPDDAVPRRDQVAPPRAAPRQRPGHRIKPDGEDAAAEHHRANGVRRAGLR